MKCAVCKKEIRDDEVAEVLESGAFVHAGVCQEYHQSQGLNESTENNVQLLVD